MTLIWTVYRCIDTEHEPMVSYTTEEQAEVHARKAQEWWDQNRRPLLPNPYDPEWKNPDFQPRYGYYTSGTKLLRHLDEFLEENGQ